METTIVKTTGISLTNEILNGYVVIPNGLGAEDLDPAGTQFICFGNGTKVRVFNGILYVGAIGRTEATLLDTYMVGTDTVREYICLDNATSMLYSKSTTRLEVYADDGKVPGAYFSPNNINKHIFKDLKVSPGSWLSGTIRTSASGVETRINVRFADASFIEPINIKDIVKYVTTPVSGIDAWMPKNLIGVWSDFKDYVIKVKPATLMADIGVGGTMESLAIALAHENYSGNLTLYKAKSGVSQKTEVYTFDGHGGYTKG